LPLGQELKTQANGQQVPVVALALQTYSAGFMRELILNA
jgi:hypothetical protein